MQQMQKGVEGIRRDFIKSAKEKYGEEVSFVP